jgi:hypothetical protein
VEVGAGAEVGVQMMAGEAEAAGEEEEEEEDHPGRACHGHERRGRQTEGQKPWRVG